MTDYIPPFRKVRERMGHPALKEKSAVLVQEPKTEGWGTSAIFQDPDGNKFVLSSRGKPK
jgi:hypothetical protein